MALYGLDIPPHSHRALLPSASDLKARGPPSGRVPQVTASPSPPGFLSSLLLSLLVYFAKNQIQ